MTIRTEGETLGSAVIGEATYEQRFEILLSIQSLAPGTMPKSIDLRGAHTRFAK
jgi:hypothetical protein